MAPKRRTTTIHFAALAESREQQNNQAILVQAIRTIAQTLPTAVEDSARERLARELLSEAARFETAMWPIER